MPVFGSGGVITHTEGSRVVWSNTRAPAKLLTSEIVLGGFDVAYPDLAKSNAYGFDFQSAGVTRAVCQTWVTVVPQSWDSGLQLVATIPAAANYFEVSLNLSRIGEPSQRFGQPIPKIFPEGQWVTLNGRGAVIERAGPLARIFRFERIGTGIYLRRKQSVKSSGPQIPWNSGNASTFPGGGKRAGWTHGGNPDGHPFAQIDLKGPSTDLNVNRGDSNACSTADPTNYASLWRGTVVINAGYLNT